MVYMKDLASRRGLSPEEDNSPHRSFKRTYEVRKESPHGSVQYLGFHMN